MSSDEMIQSAIKLHQANRLAEAEKLYNIILSTLPKHPDALHLLGVLHGQMGNRNVAIEMIKKAIVARPQFAEAFSNLGRLLAETGDVNQASSAYRRVTELHPQDSIAWYSLAVILKMKKDPHGSSEAFHRAIQLNPAYIEPVVELGKLQGELGDTSAAIESFRKAIALKPNHGEAIGRLGSALKQAGKYDEAIAAYQRALQLNPKAVDILTNLGIALFDSGKIDEAIPHYRRAIEISPGSAFAHNNLGISLVRLGKLDEAIQAFQAATLLDPSMADAYSNFGNVLRERGKTDEAILAHLQAIQVNPNYATAYSNLGVAYTDRGDLQKALESFRRAIELKPDNPDAYNNMGLALKDQGRIDEAIAAYRRAIELQPLSANAHSNLGALKETGQVGDAITAIRRAVELDPQAAELHCNLIFEINFHPAYDQNHIFQEAKIWALHHSGTFLSEIPVHCNDRSPDRKLKIGYVSGDYTFHPVGRFAQPIIANHDRNHFEIHCFSNVTRVDEATAWFGNNADRWHNIRPLSDSAAAELIAAQQIDILVDLSLHTAGNRMRLFARKPAPVQVTHLAYCGTSGMRAMDYVIADPYLLPAELEPYFTERVARLPNSYWCYRSLPSSPDANPLPALSNGFVTFGCLNNFGKVSAAALETWCQILNTVPNSRLRVHSKEGSHRESVRNRLADAGINPDRLSFAGFVPLSQYLAQYHSIDIALDPFPFAGGTTTCDALWMGVPVVSLVGQTTVSRGGLSILTNAGLAELATHSTEQYMQVAANLAADLPKLSSLRTKLRQQMQASPLMDESRYVADLETMYRTMWRNWCASAKIAGQPIT